MPSINLKNNELDFTPTFGTQHGSDVKTILTDHYWDQSQSKVGIMGLTYGNYLKMEAEYTYFVNDYTGVFTPDLLTTTLDPTGMGDVYNYVFEHEANCGDRVGP